MPRISFMRHGDRAYNNQGQPMARRNSGTTQQQRFDAQQQRPRYDAPITEEGVEQVREQFSRFIESYGPPDLIIYSPFERTRETCAVIIGLLQEYGFSVPPSVCDVRVSEFLGNQGRMRANASMTPRDALQHVSATTARLYTSGIAVADVRPDILSRFRHGMMIRETDEELYERVADFVLSIRELAGNMSARLHKDAHIFVISHGFTITTAYSFLTQTTERVHPETAEIITLEF